MNQGIGRRSFLRAAGAGCAWIAASRLGLAGETGKVRPNFVFILTDDQRWDAMGVVQREMGDRARFPWFKTPNLDRIAAGGIRFRNAFVVSSLCSPSRAAFLSGQYGHVNGVNDNQTPFPVDHPTFASLLRGAGYATGYVGKWHMSRQKGPRPGFDYSASFLGQGEYEGCAFEVNGKTETPSGWVDDASTDYALGFLRRNRDRPFALVVGFKAAHGPFKPPARRATAFEGEQARPSPNLNVPAVYRPGPAGGEAADASADVEPTTRETNLKYFRCLAAMDDNVGRLLDQLKTLGLEEHTVVVFAGDNGFYLGEHGLKDKRTAYEESMRIPLLLRYPPLGAPGKTCDELVLNVDLMPTFLDLAGVEVPRNIHGRSWRPLLEGRAPKDWRTSFFYYYATDPAYPAVPAITAVRTTKAKLVRYANRPGVEELFDLTADPYETKNLIDDPAAAELKKALATEYDRLAGALAFKLPNAKVGTEPAKPRAKKRQAGGKASK